MMLLFSTKEVTMISHILQLGMLMAVTIAPSSVLAENYHIIQRDTKIIGNLARTEFTVQVGNNPLNNFKFYRVKLKHIPDRAQQGVMLLLTCDALQFPAMYEDNQDYFETLAAYYAERNIDVWGVSHRYEKFISPICETGGMDCSIMGEWSIDTIVQDVSFVRSQIAAVHPHEKPAIMGQYFGAGSALAVINESPHDYSGIVIADGLLYTENAAVRELNQYWCDVYSKKLADGEYWDGAPNPGFKYIVALASNDPQGASPVAPGLTNLQTFVAFMDTPPPQPFTQVVPGYKMAIGDIPGSRFVYTDPERIGYVVQHFSDYIVNRFERDATCARAGVDTHHYDHLAAFRGHVYIAGGGYGAGDYMLDVTKLMRAKSVTKNIVPEYGHVDLMMAPNHRDIYETPIYRWLSHVVFR
jgi:hypothetical protein